MEKSELKAREETIIKMVSDFCNEKINAEYAELCTKMVKKLGRKRTNPLERGRLEIWAAAVVYTVGSMNFLFDKSFEPYIPSSEIYSHFSAAAGTITQKAGQIRTMLKLNRYWDPEFSTGQMKDSNPYDIFLSWL